MVHVGILVRSEDFVPLMELHKWESIGVTETRYPNTLEETIAT
jgi:hypothetical protein